MREDKFFR